MKILEKIWVSFKLLLVSIIIFSLFYPLILGGIGQLWENNVRGSLIDFKGQKVGSELIGQQFSSSKYFHSRPSSINYNALESGSANLAPNNPELQNRVKSSLEKITETEYDYKNKVPGDLITESGSALDPHITPTAAFYQIPRIAEVTGIEKTQLEQIVNEQINPRFLGVFGKKRVNVLKLNLKIEEVLN